MDTQLPLLVLVHEGVGDKIGGRTEKSVGYENLSRGLWWVNMKSKIPDHIIITYMFILIISTATNPYGEIYTYDVYYNDKLLPGTEIAKPTLKIGEPFNVKINLTVYQKCEVSVMFIRDWKWRF